MSGIARRDARSDRAGHASTADARSSRPGSWHRISRQKWGHARSALTNYLASDVLPLLREDRYRDDVRRDLCAAVAELNQLAG